MVYTLFDPVERPEKSKALVPPITYAHAVQGPLSKGMVHGIERLGGRRKVMRRLDLADVGANPYAHAMDRLGLRLDVARGALGRIPANGPLVVVANHPFGILDGLVLGYILSSLRRDFRLLAHRIVADSPLIGQHILPIDFDGTPQARVTTLDTRARAVDFLRGGGAVGVFPGGTVSTAATLGGKALDPVWRGFTARMIRQSGATVVPIWFDGQNSRLFQIASHVSTAARLGLLVREFTRRIDRPVRLAIGNPLPPESFDRFTTAKEVMDFLRRSTYSLSSDPLDADRFGHEFEEHHKRHEGDDGGRGFRFGLGRAHRS